MEKYLPDYLEILIGGCCGNSHQIKKTPDDNLEYQIMGYCYRLMDTRIISPSKEQWKTFWDEIEEIGVWNWENEYKCPEIVFDGTQWTIEILYSGKYFESYGDNNFPGGFERNIRNIDEKPETPWRLFIKSLRKLIGDENSF
jgi:hypothetical protein